MVKVKVFLDGKVAQVIGNTFEDGSVAYDVILKPKRIMCDNKYQAKGLYDEIESLISEDYGIEEI